MPPSFGDLTYWNTRFSSEENFDWLVADFTILEPVLRELINGGKRFITARVDEDGKDGGKDGKGKTPQILHIGCGNSLLSFQLRELVETAIQIHNCDYSSVVIKRQRQREKELLQTGSFGRAGGREVQTIYPPHILAIHLAYLARPGCRWVVLSYSSSRFSDWEGEGMPQGLPQPGELWKMVKHEKIVQSPDPEDKVHRPPEMHHLYILERTGVELKEV
ncbi:hypothetical protein D6D21_03653 [Aureobasidium pullulans]|uniref:Methyltransferase domain-containing protein n=1 Tax=Aureobasidium pullulans TaxID=5580 RepID=A0AB74J286_AURPU|nr:hypothetical protein D6D21_03653 [Aureobasidium pullulans]